jgi:molecular chaperone DnaK
MSNTHAVGIDLGTTYSSIASLNEHGEPITIPNEEGELSTPSAVLIDGSQVVVGTEALRNAIMQPHNVVLNAKRYIGDDKKHWVIGGRKITPIEAEALILKKLIGDAQMQIGQIVEAVITVPAQFNDAQRHATIDAGHRAGLQRVDIINEPVAASLCHVLGTEGMWFSELADEQRILVYDLGGGTFDLSIVKYQKDQVSVIAAGGDLNLGGIDFNNALINAISDQFTREFGADPRSDPSSLQALALEAEQTKRSLSVRELATLTVHHGGFRKSYQVERGQFETLTDSLVERTLSITKELLKANKMGWAHIDAVLTTGGSSRIPLVREGLKKLSGRTLNTTLSPDQSIAHGATYYAGMLLSNNTFAKSILSDQARERLQKVRQTSVTARALGVMIRDMESQQRVPHYLIPANSPLPIECEHIFGTVAYNQRQVTLRVVESSLSPDGQPSHIGQCIIDDLPPKLPEGSIIAVTIRYDEEALVHVSARDVTSGKEASTQIIRKQSAVNQLEVNTTPATNELEQDVILLDEAEQAPPVKPKTKPPAVKHIPPPSPPPPPPPSSKSSTATSPRPAREKIDQSARPIPLCNKCGEPLSSKGTCPGCGAPVLSPEERARREKILRQRKAQAARKPASKPPSAQPGSPSPTLRPKAVPSPAVRPPKVVPTLDDDDILELDDAIEETNPAPAPRPVEKRNGPQTPAPRPVPKPAQRPQPAPRKKSEHQPKSDDHGEDEFWSLGDDK